MREKAKLLLEKYPCIKYIQNSLDKEYLLDIEISFLYTHYYMCLKFKSFEECESYLDNNYQRLEYKALEEEYYKLQCKVYNQTKQLNALNTKYNKIIQNKA